ncbi:MAG: hypothetical protein HQM12_04300 [SAR324 cluster bacterium]|nr:hypothetical protein [SAR324 cluster bacterium]
MSTNEKNNNASTLANASKAGYESKVIAEALERVGNNPNLKGVIHEILVRDGVHMNPANLISGHTAHLVESTTAKAVDMVIKDNAGKIISRVQLKDTPASIGKLVQQIKSGQYNSVQIWGTPETVEQLAKNGVNLAKTVESSGISSSTTSSLAKRAGASGSGAGTSLAEAAGVASKSGAMWGGAIGGAFATAQGIFDLMEGNKDPGEVAVTVAKETAGCAVSGAAAAATATAVGVATATAVASTVITTTVAGPAIVVAAPFLAAVGVGYAVKSLWDAIFD